MWRVEPCALGKQDNPVDQQCVAQHMLEKFGPEHQDLLVLAARVDERGKLS